MFLKIKNNLTLNCNVYLLQVRKDIYILSGFGWASILWSSKMLLAFGMDKQEGNFNNFRFIV